MVSDEEITAEALAFSRRNRQRIARERTDRERYVPEAQPVSIFMAGSPGAGKTEISRSMVSFGSSWMFRTSCGGSSRSTAIR
ncbi:zeta toxin family protein [Halomonas elongata]|uniref:zeta toxin family protein n=1 Tax=Halomonas elongata TaxID=2746 RepID=UPI00255B336D|nr:zeta toxin family protein [Halomonas elongata]MDL4864233.1 zeta toxin family protein [Halomonas elongata]